MFGSKDVTKMIQTTQYIQILDEQQTTVIMFTSK